MKRISMFLSSLFSNYKFLLLASLPAIAVTAFGLVQVQVTSPVAWFVTLSVKLLVEFAFLGFCLSLLNIIGIKNKWILGILLFLYYFAMTADFVLLLYFKERFGAKYFDTLQGGDYAFMTDWRLLSYFALVGLFCGTILKKWFSPAPYKQIAKQTGLCACVLAFFIFINPFVLLGKPNNFFARYFLPPLPVYLFNALTTKPTQAILTKESPVDIAQIAKQYNVFTAQNTGIGKNYTRVILIATESLSAKYLHRFNANIPSAAGRGYDELFNHYPATTLQTVTLSTLYGLSVMFSSHPYAELSFQNNYPISFVKELKKAGFHTAFIRGAHEDYMQENELFHQAGFDVVRGWNYFEDKPEYANYLTWWGLLDRKLFDYAEDYLEQHRNEKTFLTLLTVDTHVPLGRLDYLDQNYEEIDGQFYDSPTLPRAFARTGQDIERFLKNLRDKKLLDKNTLLIVTGDHPSFSNMMTPGLFKPFDPVFDRIPFAIVTAEAIHKPLATDLLVSQLDVAPTVLDLLNLPQPKGFFGHSLFETNVPRSVFDIKEDYAVVTTANERKIFPLNSKRAEDKKLLTLMRTFWVD